MNMTASPPQTPILVDDIVHAFAALPPLDDNVVFLCARQSGLYRSTNDGNDWQSVLNSIAPNRPFTATAIALSPQFASDRTLMVGVYGGVLRSFDAGTSWSLAPLPSPPPLVSCLAFSPNYEEDGIVIAGTIEDGIFQSADRGISWQPWNFGLLDLQVLSLAVSPEFAMDGTVFAGTETGIAISKNGGRAWRDLPFPEEAGIVLSLAISPIRSPTRHLIAGTSSGLWRSDEHVQSWVRLDPDSFSAPVDCMHSYHMASEILVIATGTEIHVSRDGSHSWIRIDLGIDMARGGVADFAIVDHGTAGEELIAISRNGLLMRHMMQ